MLFNRQHHDVKCKSSILNKLKYGTNIRLPCKGYGKSIKFTQSHRPKGAIADSYDKCEPGLSCIH